MAVEYKIIIRPNGEMISEGLHSDGDCEKMVTHARALGTVLSDERIDDDTQPVHETVNS